jgi:hypothetical protein
MTQFQALMNQMNCQPIKLFGIFITILVIPVSCSSLRGTSGDIGGVEELTVSVNLRNKTQRKIFIDSYERTYRKKGSTQNITTNITEKTDRITATFPPGNVTLKLYLTHPNLQRITLETNLQSNKTVSIPIEPVDATGRIVRTDGGKIGGLPISLNGVKSLSADTEASVYIESNVGRNGKFSVDTVVPGAYKMIFPAFAEGGRCIPVVFSGETLWVEKYNPRPFREKQRIDGNSKITFGDVLFLTEGNASAKIRIRKGGGWIKGRIKAESVFPTRPLKGDFVKPRYHLLKLFNSVVVPSGGKKLAVPDGFWRFQIQARVEGNHQGYPVIRNLAAGETKTVNIQLPDPIRTGILEVDGTSFIRRVKKKFPEVSKNYRIRLAFRMSGGPLSWKQFPSLDIGTLTNAQDHVINGKTSISGLLAGTYRIRGRVDLLDKTLHRFREDLSPKQLMKRYREQEDVQEKIDDAFEDIEKEITIRPNGVRQVSFK